jgi:WD40 repeat protein
MASRYRYPAVALLAAGLLSPLAAREPRTTLKGHKGPVLAVAYSPDGKTLATGGRDKVVKLWDVKRAKAKE